jgi:hypothetical protein
MWWRVSVVPALSSPDCWSLVNEIKFWWTPALVLIVFMYVVVMIRQVCTEPSQMTTQLDNNNTPSFSILPLLLLIDRFQVVLHGNSNHPFNSVAPNHRQ